MVYWPPLSFPSPHTAAVCTNPLWPLVTSLWSLEQKAKYHKTAEFQKKRVRNESTSQTCLLLVPAVLNKLTKKWNWSHRTAKDWLMKYFCWQPSWCISSLTCFLLGMPWRFLLANIVSCSTSQLIHSLLDPRIAHCLSELLQAFCCIWEDTEWTKVHTII